MRLVCTAALLFALCLVQSAESLTQYARTEGAQVLQTQNYYIPMRVAPEEFTPTLDQLDKLMAFSKENKMSQNIQMFIRTASVKVKETLANVEKMATEEKAAKEVEQKKASKSGPTPFTTVAGHSPDFTKQVGVKRLKGSGAKKSTVKRYTAEKLPGLLKAGKVDLTKPFIVSAGEASVEKLQHKFTALSLMDNSEAKVRYLSPVKAKEKRSFDKQQQQTKPGEEEMEYQMISTEKYLVNCFNLRAKPDFRRLGGTQTEHCEMSLPTSTLDPTMADFQLPVVSALTGYAPLEKAREAFAARAQKDLSQLVPKGVDLAQTLLAESSNSFVFGPSGAGEQLRQEGHSFVDGLVHGKKRWFLMEPRNFQKLRKEAGEVMEPASAFIFFEQQMEELVEDYELGTEIPYWDVNQLPGDIIYIPGNMIMTSLNYQDSFSFKQRVLTQPGELAAKINAKIWDPQSGEVPRGFKYAVCKAGSVSAAGEELGTQINPQQIGIIENIMAQFFPSPEAQNQLIIQILGECVAVLDAGLTDTYCSAVFSPCVTQLRKNAKKMKIDDSNFNTVIGGPAKDEL